MSLYLIKVFPDLHLTSIFSVEMLLIFKVFCPCRDHTGLLLLFKLQVGGFFNTPTCVLNNTLVITYQA